MCTAVPCPEVEVEGYQSLQAEPLSSKENYQVSRADIAPINWSMLEQRDDKKLVKARKS